MSKSSSSVRISLSAGETSDRAAREHGRLHEDGQLANQRVFPGKGVSPEVAMGPVHVLTRDHESDETDDEGQGPDEELARFEAAVERSERELSKIVDFTREKLGAESAEIFTAQRMMLRDEAVFNAVCHKIRSGGYRADAAVSDVLSALRRRIESGSDEYLRERGADLADVEDRLRRNLRRGRIMEAIKPGDIVVAERLAAADLVLFSRREVQACITAHGGTTSHVAIIARALGLPTIMGAREAVDTLKNDDLVIVDALRGHIIARPTKRVQEAYRHQLQRHEQRHEQQLHWRDRPAETSDGHRVTLRANLEFSQETEVLGTTGAEGIGLFRTEMLLMISGITSFKEEETYQTYRQVVEAARPHITTLRLLDLGGDKLLPRAHREHNPFLGWRGIRVLLDRPNLLRAQLRATLRAAAHGPLRVLLPMVMDLSEIRTVRSIIADVAAELHRSGVKHEANIPVGIMVEVPSVALQADRYAREVDFFSIGTNDLTQYILAVDRGNDLVANRFSAYHPVVITLIRRIASAGKRAGISVSLCGEMASDPRAAPVLVGAGIKEFSVSPVYLPGIKQAIRAFSREHATALVDKLVELSSAIDVEAMLQQWIEVNAPDVGSLSGSAVVDEVLAP